MKISLKPLWAALVLLVCCQALCQESEPFEKPNLAYQGPTNAVVLIIRHAEKPEKSETDVQLNPKGYQRAKAYVDYFKSYQLDGKPLKLDYLFAATDSNNSHRPRLTIEPLSQALQLRINTNFSDKKPMILADELHVKDHGHQILVAWRHSGIPKLIAALGADPAKLLPAPRWPEEVFDWVIELHYDQNGKLLPTESRRLNEKLMPGDAAN